MAHRTLRQDEFDTIELDCIDEDPTQPVAEPHPTIVEDLTPTHRFRQHLSLQPIPLTPLPELHDEPPTVDEATEHNRACTTVEYHLGASIPEDSDLIPLPRRETEIDDAWFVDTRERTLRFRRWRRNWRKRRRQRR